MSETEITETAAGNGNAAQGSDVVHFPRSEAPERRQKPTFERPLPLKMPTAGQLLDTEFTERRHLLFPWLREQESCMVYAPTGVGQSLFSLSAAIAVAGRGRIFRCEPPKR